MIQIASIRQKTKTKWLCMPDTFPDFLEEISPSEKNENELAIQCMEDEVNKQLAAMPIGIRRKKTWAQKVQKMILDFLQNDSVLGLHQVMSESEIRAFLEETMSFFKCARGFAPEMRIDGIGQAARNYLVFQIFGKMNRACSPFSEACFAYSMLYPFTDNYIDRSDISPEEKATYNRLIYDKISGKLAAPQDEYQEKTCALLSMIASNYERASGTQIFSLLLMMLEAQEDSMRVQEGHEIRSMDERLDISIYKGGISVLIDRFFVDIEMTKESAFFYFAFGFLLQLADDLQDISEDARKDNQTLFTLDTTSENNERMVNRMFHYVHHLIGEDYVGKDEFLPFLLAQCNGLICSSVFRSKEHFSPEYLARMEKILVVSSSFLEKKSLTLLERADVVTQNKYLRILDSFLCGVTL